MCFCVFFFKQKTAYEMRISDGSSDVCSSDLEWIGEEGAFPETMVDRIVPATTPDDVAALAARLDVEDRAMVKTEPFIQWVIEDRFCGPRPKFGAGVQLTAAVAPWEEAKLRLLNGEIGRASCRERVGTSVSI